MSIAHVSSKAVCSRGNILILKKTEKGERNATNGCVEGERFAGGERFAKADFVEKDVYGVYVFGDASV